MNNPTLLTTKVTQNPKEKSLMPMVLALQAPARHLDRPDPIRTHPLGVPQQMVALEVGDNTQVSNDGSDPRIWQGTVYNVSGRHPPRVVDWVHWMVRILTARSTSNPIVSGQHLGLGVDQSDPHSILLIKKSADRWVRSINDNQPLKFQVNQMTIDGYYLLATSLPMLQEEKELEFKFVPFNIAAGDHNKEHSISNSIWSGPALEDGDLKLIDLRAIVKDISHEYTRKAMEPIYRDSNKKMTIMVWMEVEAHQFDREALKRAWELFNKPIFGLTTNLAVVATSTENPGKGLDVYEARQGQNEYLGGETFMLIDLHHLPYLHYKMEQSSILISFLSIVIMQIVVEEAKEPKNMVTDIKNATSLVLELCGTFFIGKLIQSLSVTLFIFLFSS
ncbi:glutathione S-transferase-like protein [Cinnamomum micranthum f. kanehirae]|uniref:glutathione transferase n=1 Tax=Cinnamomum micranthum f. kanehirae TaxID=337451 RepID=A0A3S3MGX9_9MAGN|nr:glutathione S-transferase-like protein [Cinnamomum micranthum f. kanehirae]